MRTNQEQHKPQKTRRGITQFLPPGLTKKRPPKDKTSIALKNIRCLAFLTLAVQVLYLADYIYIIVHFFSAPDPKNHKIGQNSKFEDLGFWLVILQSVLSSIGLLGCLYLIITSCKGYPEVEARKVRNGILVVSLTNLGSLVVFLVLDCLSYLIYWLNFGSSTRGSESSKTEESLLGEAGGHLMMLTVPFVVLNLWFCCIFKQVGHLYDLAKEGDLGEADDQYQSGISSVLRISHDFD